MKKIFLALLPVLCTLSVSAQKSINDPNVQKRNVKNFTSIQVSGGIDLYLTQSNEEAVAVSAAKEEYRDKIITEVIDGVLKIYYERDSKNWSWGSNWSNRKLKAYVSIKTIEKLRASGGSDVYAEDGIKSTRLSLHFSGGSDFKGRIDADDLSITASGGSDVSASGNANKLTVEASGGSDVKISSLASEYAKVHASGGSDISLQVNKELDARASGGSDIYYKGSATRVSTSKSGSSDITKRQ